MTTDFRALCAELLCSLEQYPVKPPKDRDLIDRARAALAHPEPEGPSNEELLGLDELKAAWNSQADAFNSWDELGVDEIIWFAQQQALARFARTILVLPEPQGATDEELLESAAKALGYKSIHSNETCLTAEAGELLAFARAVLARWGRPAIEPVPVAERLPGPEDCDADGRCWWWYPPRRSCYGYWQHEDEATEREDDESPVAWLPHHALPVPQQEVK
jgi:hypothetical protein